MIIQNIKQKITPVLKRQGVIKAAFFGSVARGETKRNSDIDLLIKIKESKSLLDIVRLKLELEKKLGRKVDL
ncbi:MAG: nucleotidyltransferase domain-containing protein [Candidatus Brennerbacteria bacterium]|nr:nucleotidyltransferase domain-containing protein [Candidatus Brennerbacteria bacterium]